MSVDDTSDNSVMKRMLNHTFVALIDIVFTDDSKRTCTGTIIHDNVIITAAHCFSKTYDKFIKPELTSSFVVIGCKKMFEMGYEQYLPIERIVNHPKFRGWTADLALVFTFAGMMSEKPGTIMPLAGEKMSTPTHSNVTILSWGRCQENDVRKRVHEKKRTKYPLRANTPYGSTEDSLT
ncbi:serine protease 27-like [Epargyreus clarus]|uniref:serine protease 27-like n=1 Tax=Epargyreus clarus TaxID=520877 RepID=UPI003C30E232